MVDKSSIGFIEKKRVMQLDTEISNGLIEEWSGTVSGGAVTLHVAYTDKYTIMMTYTQTTWAVSLYVSAKTLTTFNWYGLQANGAGAIININWFTIGF